MKMTVSIAGFLYLVGIFTTGNLADAAADDSLTGAGKFSFTEAEEGTEEGRAEEGAPSIEEEGRKSGAAPVVEASEDAKDDKDGEAAAAPVVAASEDAKDDKDGEAAEAAAAPLEASLEQTDEIQAEAERAVEQAAAVEDKALEGVQSLISQIGESPTPQQRERFVQAVNSYVEAAKQSEKAETTQADAKQKTVSTRIKNNISSNTPSEPGF